MSNKFTSEVDLVKRPEFSIITPVFNGGAFLESTIHSVLEYARNEPYEYIIVDNASTDNTRAIIESFGDSVILLEEHKKGEGFAVNAALEISRGRYALVVNCDDPLFTKEIFSDVANIFQSNENVVAVYSDWRTINSQGHVIKLNFPREFSLKALVAELDCLPGPGAFFRIEVALAVGGRNPDWKYVSDYEFWLRMSTMGIFHKKSGITAQWRIHEGSITGTSSTSRISEQRNIAAEVFVKSTQLPIFLRMQALSNIYFQEYLFEYYVNKRVAWKELFLSGFNGIQPYRFRNLRTVFYITYARIGRKTVDD